MDFMDVLNLFLQGVLLLISALIHFFQFTNGNIYFYPRYLLVLLFSTTLETYSVD